MAWKNAKGGIVWWLNKLFNPSHSWTQYWDENTNTETDSSYTPASDSGGTFNSLMNKITGAGLTGAEQEANAFSSAEAEKSRDWQEYMVRNKYQMETQSMQEAGVNPAMVYGGGSLVPTASNGASANSVTPDSGLMFDLINTFLRLPAELDQMRAAAEEHRALGKAALQNARTNSFNAGVNAGNLKVNERMATVAELRQQVDERMAESNISVNNEQKNVLAESAAKLLKERQQMDAYLAVAEKNANSQQKQAIAAMRNADAAVQDAATRSYLSDYQSSLMYSQEMLNWYEGEGKEIINKYLDERQRAELEKIIKEGVKLDKEGNLIDKQGNLCTAEMIKTYINCGTDIANSVSRFVGISALTGNGAPEKVQSYLWTPKGGNYAGESFGPAQMILH